MNQDPGQVILPSGALAGSIIKAVKGEGLAEL